MMDKLLTPQEAAEYLAVKTKTVKRWLQEGKLKGVKVRRLWRVREKDLEAFVQTPRGRF